MVQELKERPKAVNRTKYVHLIFWIIAILVLVFVTNKLWSHYKGQRSFITKQIEYLENKVSMLSPGSHSDVATNPEIKSIDEKTTTEIQLRDAYFMVRIAATILQNDHDIHAAMELLNTAQEHLNNLQGEKIDQAKTILAADISKLSAVQVSDTHDVQDKLTLLDKLSVMLPLKPEAEAIDVHKDDTITKDTTANVNDQGRWPQSIQNFWSEAKTVVKVRKKPTGEVQLSGAAMEIKRAQFRLLIEQLRWALFYKDSDVYKASIIKIQQLMPEIFNMNSDIVKQFTSTLTEMSNAQINIDVPNIQESVNALKALLVG